MPQTNTPGSERSRYLITKALVNEQGPIRDVTESEDDRVEELLNEKYIDPYQYDGKLKRLGRSLLEQTGVYTPKKPQLADRPFLENSQQTKREIIKSDLDHIRTLFRENILHGVDDVATDVYLDLDSDDSIVPPLFRHLHTQAKQEAGKDMTFIKWASDVATDDQLLNLMQWHDTYLKDLDNNPEFRERIHNLKQQYVEGLRVTQAKGLIHPDVLADTAILDEIAVRHASPFSPIIPGAAAFILAGKIPEIHIKPGLTDDAFFHELTHAAGGFIQQFDEGQVDRMAIAIYNATRDTEHQKSEQDSVYRPQIEILDALQSVDAETFSLLETSRAFTHSSSAAANTLGLIEAFDDKLGFPLLLCLTKTSQELRADNSEKFTQADVSRATQIIMQKDVQLAVKVLLSEGKEKIPATIPEFVQRFTRMSDLTPDEMQSLIYIAAETHKLAHQEK